MDKRTETLAELADTRITELGQSLRKLAAHSSGLLSHAELHDIRRGGRIDLSEHKIIGLARALGIGEDRIRAAIETSRTQQPLQLPGRLNLLDDNMRQALIAVGDSLLDLQRKVTSQGKRDRTAAAQAHGRRRKSSAS